MPQSLTEMQAFKPGNLTLIDCLAELEKYGNPRISKDKGSWYCAIEVFVIGEGTEFKVRSEFKHKTHEDAANLCLARLKTELKRIKETK